MQLTENDHALRFFCASHDKEIRGAVAPWTSDASTLMCGPSFRSSWKPLLLPTAQTVDPNRIYTEKYARGLLPDR